MVRFHSERATFFRSYHSLRTGTGAFLHGLAGLERGEALERPRDLLRRARLQLSILHRLVHRLVHLPRFRGRASSWSRTTLYRAARPRHELAVARRRGPSLRHELSEAHVALPRLRQLAEGLEQRRPRFGRRRAEVTQLAVEPHPQRCGVQGHAIEGVAALDLLGVGERAVARVAEQVVPAHRAVLADLVRASRAELEVDHREEAALGRAHHAVGGRGGHAVCALALRVLSALRLGGECLRPAALPPRVALDDAVDDAAVPLDALVTRQGRLQLSGRLG
eukprot:scaffold110694_cov66-Phaeocystis_antarctica.AAC.5